MNLIYNPTKILQYYKESNAEQIYCYTITEADHWVIKKIHLTSNEVLEQVKLNNNYIIYDSAIKSNIKLNFYCLMFPNGRVWDSSMKGFRI